MSVANRPLTYDDLLQMPADGRRYEIVDGELIVAAAPLADHQDVLFELASHFRGHVKHRRLGKVYVAPLTVRLTPHDVVEPDIVFLPLAKRPLLVNGIVEGAPDLVVEILSPSTRTYDEVRKAALYAATGVPEYWLVDLIALSIRVFTLVDGRYQAVPEPRPGVVASLVLPGFEVGVADLFADLW